MALNVTIFKSTARAYSNEFFVSNHSNSADNRLKEDMNTGSDPVWILRHPWEVVCTSSYSNDADAKSAFDLVMSCFGAIGSVVPGKKNQFVI